MLTECARWLAFSLAALVALACWALLSVPGFWWRLTAARFFAAVADVCASLALTVNGWGIAANRLATRCLDLAEKDLKP